MTYYTMIIGLLVKNLFFSSWIFAVFYLCPQKNIGSIKMTREHIYHSVKHKKMVLHNALLQIRAKMLHLLFLPAI